MTNQKTPIEVGDRFESRDRRDAGRIVEVVEIVNYRYTDGKKYKIRTEVHPKNPSAVGLHWFITSPNLRARYTKVSR